MFRARPLLPLAIGFVAGIAVAGKTDPWLPLLALALIAAALIIRSRHPVLIGLLGMALGGLRQEWAETRTREMPGEVIEGIVDGPPRVFRTLEDPDSSSMADGSFIVGRVQVRYFGLSVPLIGGERVRVRGSSHPPRHATNPGQFDYGAWLERKGIDAVMTLQKVGDLRILEGPPFWSRARARLRSLFDRGMRPEVGAFESAIVLGRREAVPDGLVTNLQRTGTAHLLALSGQNLVIVMMSFFFILTLLGIHGRAQIFVLLAVMGLYTLLTGLQISVVRSYVMMAAFFGADLAWRRRDALSAMAASALLICVLDPAQIFDVGFQLSFVAVLGLIFIAPIFHAFTGAGGGLWNLLRTSLGVSVAAWLATAPIVLENFNLLTPGIVLANLFLVPLLTLEFIVGLLHLALAPVGLAVVSGTAANFLFDVTGAVAEMLTQIPLCYAYAPFPGSMLIGGYYAALAAWTGWCRHEERAWKPVLILLLVIPLGLGGLRHRAPDGLFLAVLDVGRGSCAYLEWPDGRNMMVDCGSLNVHDPGASIAAKYLWSRGVTRLDTLALSHTDADHVNGARSVIDLMRVKRVIVTQAFKDWTWPPGVDVVPVERTGLPFRMGDIEILGPPVWEKYGSAIPINETSLVLRAGGILLPGDVEERGAEELMTLPDIRARVLVMPHHGKFFKQHEEFVRRVAPEQIVVSAPEGYYSRKVIDALPFPPRLTGREGAIEIILK